MTVVEGQAETSGIHGQAKNHHHQLKAVPTRFGHVCPVAPLRHLLENGHSRHLGQNAQNRRPVRAETHDLVGHARDGVPRLGAGAVRPDALGGQARLLRGPQGMAPLQHVGDCGEEPGHQRHHTPDRPEDRTGLQPNRAALRMQNDHGADRAGDRRQHQEQRRLLHQLQESRVHRVNPRTLEELVIIDDVSQHHVGKKRTPRDHAIQRKDEQCRDRL
mmetsp:Transcript_4663/g.14066  ORF Transcript_4663/g.14066 Transcript_4663/m.14066 type:complete len:217 (-) Transcript_4663:263-913(-)